MDTILSRCIKDYENLDETSKRSRVGIFTGIVGIVVNLCLVILKLVAGFITGAVSITADAANNFSDAASSIVTLIGFKMAGKPADKEHPYGHGRMEYIAGLVVAELILLMGAELLHTSVLKIIHPDKVIFSIVSIVILVFSILAKVFLALINNKLGHKFNSTTMLATASDSRNDVLATSVVLISVILTSFSNFNFDAYAGALVAILVLIAGVCTIRDTVSPLLGKAPDEKMVSGIKRIVLSNNKIYGFHDLIVHDYGPGRKFVSLHAEIDKDLDLVTAHDCVDSIEKQISEEFKCYVSIHADPIDIGYKHNNQFL